MTGADPSVHRPMPPKITKQSLSNLNSLTYTQTSYGSLCHHITPQKLIHSRPLETIALLLTALDPIFDLCTLAVMSSRPSRSSGSSSSASSYKMPERLSIYGERGIAVQHFEQFIMWVVSCFGSCLLECFN
jgi:hypothetical protein